MKLSFLGPNGSYSHQAALNLYGQGMGIELIPCHSINQIVQSLENGDSNWGIVPVENSIAGGVSETIDALLKADNTYVYKEYILPITHCLLVKTKLKLEDIKKIKSHPMSFGQCQEFIQRFCPNAELISCSSNSSAALDLSQNNDENTAVIASKFCADFYGLQILQEQINDNELNETRFWILSKETAAKSNAKNKSTIVFQTKDEPGSLQTILRLFAVNHVNLSRIESRPAKRNIGEYMFIIDFDLHKEDKKFEDLIRQAKQHFSYYKWLGSYSK